MRYFRKQQFYDAVFADLVLMGALPKNVVEAYFNAEIPNTLSPPWDGPPPAPSIDHFDLTAKLTSTSTVPVTGAPIVRDFDDEQYQGETHWYRLTGTSALDFAWTLDAGGTFQANSIYCAFVHITPKTGFSTTGITWQDWTHNSTAAPWFTVKASPAAGIPLGDPVNATIPVVPAEAGADVAFAFTKTEAA